jgi:hypothetical protein
LGAILGGLLGVPAPSSVHFDWLQTTITLSRKGEKQKEEEEKGSKRDHLGWSSCEWPSRGRGPRDLGRSYQLVSHLSICGGPLTSASADIQFWVRFMSIEMLWCVFNTPFLRAGSHRVSKSQVPSPTHVSKSQHGG